MADINQITALRRDGVGKGAARAARREGQVPAVIYGGKEAPLPISLERRMLEKEIHREGFFAHLYDIEVDGTAHRVLARDVQLDPVKDLPIHVDFLRVSATTEVNVDVPVHFVNQEESPGLERGGMLNVVRYTLELVCKADSIPESVEVDLTGLEIGDSVHISQVALPAGVRPAIEDRDFTVASVAAPSAIKEEAAEEQAAEEAEEEEEFEGEAEVAEAAEGEAAAEESGEGESET